MSSQFSEVSAMRIEIARSKLANKLSVLERRVTGTIGQTKKSVHDVSASIQSTIGCATGAVQQLRQLASGDLLSSINALAPVRNAPWSSVGLALVAGLISGGLVGGKPRAHVASTSNGEEPGIKSTLKRELISIGASVISDMAGMVRSHLHSFTERQPEAAAEMREEADQCCVASSH